MFSLLFDVLNQRVRMQQHVVELCWVERVFLFKLSLQPRVIFALLRVVAMMRKVLAHKILEVLQLYLLVGIFCVVEDHFEVTSFSEFGVV